MNVFRGHSSRNPGGFTLVEILTVIVIIGILAGIAVPAIFRAVTTANSTKMRLELGAIEQGIHRYQEKYGDYPPDFSDWAVVERHYRKIFPRITSVELNLLKDATDVNPWDGNSEQAHDPTAMDRAEVLNFVLGGYSSNAQQPFTGAGGPWEPFVINNTTYYQVNMDRDNELYEFDTARLDLEIYDPGAGALSPTNRFKSEDDDLFLSYGATEDGAPFTYFDSRTYAYEHPTLGFNGFASTNFGNIRPYLSDIAVPNTTGLNYTTAKSALAAWQFINKDTFQVISPGLDSNYGFSATAPPATNGEILPLYFQYPSGNGIAPYYEPARNPTGTPPMNSPDDLLIPTITRYQETQAFSTRENFQQDNLTNFSRANIIDDLEE